MNSLEVTPLDLLVFSHMDRPADKPRVVEPVKEEHMPAAEGLKVVETGEHKPVVVDGYLYITVEGDSPADFEGLEAKNLAWAKRFIYGFGVAGIDAPYPPIPKPVGKLKEGDVAPAPRYLKKYRITPGL